VQSVQWQDVDTPEEKAHTRSKKNVARFKRLQSSFYMVFFRTFKAMALKAMA